MKNDPNTTKVDNAFEKFRVQSIDRAFSIIDVVSGHVPESITLTEIAAETSLHISTAYRIVQNLLYWQYLREGADGRYQLGWQFLYLGSKLQNNTSLITVASPYLHALGNATGQTIYLTILTDNGKHVLYMNKVESKGAIQLSSGVGTKNRVYSTASGKALLSNWKPDRILALLQEFEMKPLTFNTITSPEVFLNEVKRTAERGYALDLEENENNVICIAAPIHDCLGNNIAAISLSGVYTMKDFAMIQEQYIRLTVETAQKISACMGYKG